MRGEREHSLFSRPARGDEEPPDTVFCLQEKAHPPLQIQLRARQTHRHTHDNTHTQGTWSLPRGDEGKEKFTVNWADSNITGSYDVNSSTN